MENEVHNHDVKDREAHTKNIKDRWHL